MFQQLIFVSKYSIGTTEFKGQLFGVSKSID